MKFGLIPLCEQAYSSDPRWVSALVPILEDEAVESVWIPEHVVMAEDYEPLYEYFEDGRAPVAPTTMMPDPLQWLSFAAAHSENLRLGTSVLIGPQHSAAILAKRIAMLDALSGGRLRIGIGIGWQKQEYQAVGVPYSQRGKRLDELLDAMRLLWLDGPATFRGDGFFPYMISPNAMAPRMESVRNVAATAGCDLSRFSVTGWLASFSPGATFDLELARACRDAGADRLVLAGFEAQGHDLEQQRRLVADYRDKVIAAL